MWAFYKFPACLNHAQQENAIRSHVAPYKIVNESLVPNTGVFIFTNDARTAQIFGHICPLASRQQTGKCPIEETQHGEESNEEEPEPEENVDFLVEPVNLEHGKLYIFLLMSLCGIWKIYGLKYFEKDLGD
jgi:hypothetical protein